MAAIATHNFDNPGNQVIKPIRLAHVVLRTNIANLARQKEFYLTFLGGRVQHENDYLCFITYDDEHHRIALVGLQDTGSKIKKSCGLEHIAFSFETLADLMLAYKQRLQHGIKPIWCVNHGPTTSMYYRDPDGNMLETQVDNFDTAEEANEFMMDTGFAENPIGVDFDPEELIARIKSGESEESLKFRPNIGKRLLPDFDAE